MPASRSRIAPKTLGESNRGRQSHSTAPLGATSADVSQSERNPYSAIGANGLAPVTLVGHVLIGPSIMPNSPDRDPSCGRPPGRDRRGGVASPLASGPFCGTGPPRQAGERGEIQSENEALRRGHIGCADIRRDGSARRVVV